MGVVRVSSSDKGFALVLPKDLFQKLELDPAAEYELVKVRKGIWVLAASEKPLQKENLLDKRIFSLIAEKNLRDRVEGKFEKFLSKEELLCFKELLKQGRVVAFRLSPKYSKAVYKTREEAEGAKEKPLQKKYSESSNAVEKPLEEYCLEKDGFTVCKNAVDAKILSEKLRRDIEEGRIRGIKSFDSFFYVMEEALYQKHRQKVLSLVKAEKGIGSEKISEKAGISKLLAKIVCEFLKEEGEIIEKRKDLFQAV